MQKINLNTGRDICYNKAKIKKEALNMPVYFLAVDIGASSGRHILGSYEGGRIVLEEVYRFKNGMVEKDGSLCWDVDSLVESVILGMRKCAEIGKIPSYMGIDTWGVDYVLVDKDGKRLGEAMGYRDSRCARGMAAVDAIIPFDELYARTGIQRLDYNTVNQLMADKLERPELLAAADKLLMIPDYIGFCLTGVAHQEYTNATTGSFVNIESGEFDTELIARLGYPAHLFGKLSMPGETLGKLSPEVRERVGYDLTVIHPASHDTGSAVLAVPTNSSDAVYLSSGTWSLMGAERYEPLATPGSMAKNFTHEGGYGRSIRYLTNIMGLWIIQSIKKEEGDKYSFTELSDMARGYSGTVSRINVNDRSLLAPRSMLAAVRALIGDPEAPLPAVLAAVYHGLADYYVRTVKDLEEVTGVKATALHVIGGGSRDAYLNALTAEGLDIPVYAGPTEATAIGNVLAQMISTGVFSSVSDARRAVYESFEVTKV